jgi:predicted nucleic acid-binding protein
VEAFLDSSVFVAAYYEDDKRHIESAALLSRYTRSKLSTAAHSLAEVYATLTGMKGGGRVSVDLALLFIEDIRNNCIVVSLDEDEYWDALRNCGSLGLTSGAIYDLLIATCARKAAAKTIYTWNRRHFDRLGPEIAKRVKEPGR